MRMDLRTRRTNPLRWLKVIGWPGVPALAAAAPAVSTIAAASRASCGPCARAAEARARYERNMMGGGGGARIGGEDSEAGGRA